MNSMVLGDKYELEADVKDMYQKSGVSHLLAISGLHISIAGMSVYNMLRNILLVSKMDKTKRLEIYNIVDAEIYYQRICIRIMYNQKWIDEKKYKHSNELLAEIGKILGGLIKSLEVKKYA